MTTTEVLQEIRDRVLNTPRKDRTREQKLMIKLDRKLSNGEVIPEQWMDK